MNIEGTYTFQSRLTEIRQSLTRQEVLQQAIPGLEHLEPIENNRYNVAIHIKYPPLAGTYQGRSLSWKTSNPLPIVCSLKIMVVPISIVTFD